MDDPMEDNYDPCGSPPNTSEGSNREKVLGYKPQKEFWFNKHLPYADKLDEESLQLLATIKENFALALVNKEMNPGMGICASQLMCYMRLYGFKFSKEDHVLFIKVLLEAITIPFLETAKVNKFCTILNQLLEKTNLLSPDDLQIEWRPLYELSKIYLKQSGNKAAMYRFFQALENHLHYVIILSRPYFPESATQEILDEMLPSLEPLDVGKGAETFELLSQFLNPHRGYEVWLEKFLKMWDVYLNPVWSVDMMNLIASVARNNVGVIDWEPYIPSIFTRILRSLELPVTYKNLASHHNQTLLLPSVVQWIVAVLGPNSSAQKYLNNLMATIETYVHPANSGKWVETLNELLATLAVMFEQRLIGERYTKPSWLPKIPETHCLTEDCITQFVTCLRPVAYQAIYSRMNSTDVGKMFKVLAELRPELIIPGVIDRVWNSLDLLTEPHKLTASLQTLVKVARPLVTGHNGYTDGRKHVIPIFHALLPGIDPNDFRKTCVVLEFYVSFSLFIPMVDCSQASQYYDDLTEEETFLCSQTASLEDFMLQFLDRTFMLIDSYSTQIVRLEQAADGDSQMSKLEAIAESSLLSSLYTLITQCSDEIVAAVSQKTLQFVKTHIYEPRVASVVGGLIRVVGRVAGQDFYRSIVPYLLGTLNGYFVELGDDEVAQLNKQNDEVLYFLNLLFHMVRGDPKQVIGYVDDLLPMIDRLQTFKCPQTAIVANNMIWFMLSNFSNIQTESRVAPLSKVLHVRHWGVTMAEDDEIEWHIPGERERATCERIIHRYLVPTLEYLDRYSRSEETPTREELLKRINSVVAVLKAHSMLPNWTVDDERRLVAAGQAEIPYDGKVSDVVQSIVKKYQFELYMGESHIISMPDGGNVRLRIVQTMVRVQAKVLRDSEDDIKSMRAIYQVWDQVHMRRHCNQSFEVQMKNYYAVNNFKSFRLTKKRRSLRCLVAMRAMLQLYLREELAKPLFTQTHGVILKQLLELATSKYSGIRQISQTLLLHVMGLYPFSYRILVDDMAKLLRLDPADNYEQFKGALYILKGHRSNRLLVKHEWVVVKKLWIALLETQFSEKPAVIKLMEGLSNVIIYDFPTLNVRLRFPERCQEMAMAFCPAVASDKDAIARGIANELATNESNEKMYYEIMDAIMDIVKKRILHWRYNLLASTMLLNLTHPNVKQPEIVARYFLQNLLSDSLTERKIAIQAVGYILLQQKRVHKKVIVDPFKIGNVAAPEPWVDLLPGLRDDNRWLQYDLDKVPKNQQEWDEFRYIFKPQGFFGWRGRGRLEMYAPSAEQPDLDWTRDQMTEVQRTILDFFSSDENVTKMITYWCLEEKKKDKFRRGHFYMIRALGNMFGDQFLGNFVSHLERLITAKEQVEGNHRSAAEIMAGIVRGTKHWPYEKTERLMTQTMVPMIRLALSNLTADTGFYWGTCFSEACDNMDPKRLYWIYEVLMEDPLKETASFIDCDRIMCLQLAFNWHVWRMNSYGHRILNYFRPHLAHPFQNVRINLGHVLINVFEMDFQYPGSAEPECPRIRDFVAEVMPQLKLLHNDFPLPVAEGKEAPETKIFLDAVRLFKTVSSWVTVFMNRSTNGNRLEYFELLPIACHLERCEQDTELALDCTKLLSMISQALTLADTMDAALDKIDEVSRMTFWSARLAVLGVLQVLVFNNMPLVLSRAAWVTRVQEIVLRLLEDKVLEVREKAAQVLGGLVHCSFLPATERLLELFKKKCRTKVNGKGRTTAATTTTTVVMNAEESEETRALLETGEQIAVRTRHTGVLGLCAFISAYPYDIPDFVPDVFEHLGANLNDPQPIPSTIRKTVGDFKRTHHDNWEMHQAKFTKSQLDVLSDLTVPPSYYN